MSRGAMTAMIAAGFYGKLPSYGDFVQAGLPRSFVDGWDFWCRSMLSWSREGLGERWQPSWMQAPIWRFRLPAGLSGPAAVTGVWLPSLDRVGRCFPLAIAAVSSEHLPDTEFLDHAEQIGLDALELDLTPEQIMQRLPRPSPLQPPPHRSHWWSSGSPLVRASTFELDGWPDAGRCTRMLADEAS